jgi:hypothetical protein
LINSSGCTGAAALRAQMCTTRTIATVIVKGYADTNKTADAAAMPDKKVTAAASMYNRHISLNLTSEQLFTTA